MLMKKLSDSEYWELLDAVSNFNVYSEVFNTVAPDVNDNPPNTATIFSLASPINPNVLKTPAA